MLRVEDLRSCLNPNLDQIRKDRFEVAFRSLGAQEDYCRYHYEQFHTEHALFISSMHGELKDKEILNPQYYRVNFEANCFAFFRAFLALLESLPYLLNIMLEVKIDPEFRFLSWKTITESCTKKQIFGSEIVMINNLLESDTYKELNHFVNVSKHRRIVRIDSGLFSESSKPKLCKDDLDIEFKTYDIDTIMQTVFDDLHVKAIDLLKSFLNSFSEKYS